MPIKVPKLPRIAVVHPFLRPAGGSEARAMHIADELSRDYDVTLITMGTPDLDKLNEYYGTHIDRDKVNVISFSIPLIAKKRLHALRTYRLARYCVKNSNAYDVMISTYNMMDFGQRGIQFIADFSFHDELREAVATSKDDFLSFLRRKRHIRRIYLGIVRWLSGTSRNGWEKNITVANSNWTSQSMRNEYGVECSVIYPPVLDSFPDIPWKDKENGFIYIGRISPEKKIENIIEVLHLVRKKGLGIHLHVIGELDDSGYSNKIKKMSEEYGSWISMEGKMIGDNKAQFLSRHRYGISARLDEAFGISVAEMVKAGCLVWICDGGGQKEIVEHPDLIYSSKEDGVDKICRIIESENKQLFLSDVLKNRSEKFSVEKFRNEVRNLVTNYLENQASRPN